MPLPHRNLINAQCTNPLWSTGWLSVSTRISFIDLANNRVRNSFLNCNCGLTTFIAFVKDMLLVTLREVCPKFNKAEVFRERSSTMPTFEAAPWQSKIYLSPEAGNIPHLNGLLTMLTCRTDTALWAYRRTRCQRSVEVDPIRFLLVPGQTDRWNVDDIFELA